MKKYYILAYFLLLTFYSFAQPKHDYQWILDRFVLMDFREDTLKLSTLHNTTDYGPGDFCTSISNYQGDLQFYSGGCYIINSENVIMENGDSINSDYGYIDFCTDGDFPMIQSNTVVPFPQNDHKYIYFNLDINIISGNSPHPLHFYYHVIDMEMDGGLGAVTEKKQVAISDTLTGEYIQGVRHANGEDWWVIAIEKLSNCYYIVPVTGDGVGAPIKQCIGTVWNDLDGGGQAVFSPDGKKYAKVEAENGWHIFDFDAEIGTLSNPIILQGKEEDNYFRGAAFSPNSRYLYVSARMDLFQFDLEADDIQESKQLVGQLNPDDAFPGVGTLALQKLAPDGKIYIASPGAHRYLSVINSPNCPGVSCDFQPWALELPVSNYAGLPNLPHFSVPATNQECDSVVLASHLVKDEMMYQVFPNPASEKIVVRADRNISSFIVYNIYGKSEKNGLVQNGGSEINISSLRDGMYFLELFDQKNQLVGSEKILILKR